jgi:hypothetical protein
LGTACTQHIHPTGHGRVGKVGNQIQCFQQ